MKRRKKSILFPTTLAAAGLVAGSLIAIQNNINAYDFSKMDLPEIANVLSKDIKTVDADAISEALETKSLIVATDNEDALGDSKCDSLRGVIFVCHYDTVQETGAYFRALSENKDIDGVSLNYVLKLEQNNYDEFLDYSASVKRIDLEGYQAWGVRTMYLDRYADSLENKTNTLKVAVLDSGINASHLIFDDNGKNRIDTSQSKNYLDPDNITTNVNDDNGHGTMVSGVIVESTPRNVTIVPIKICDSAGGCPVVSILYGADYAAQLGVDVVNMSVGITQADVNKSEVVLNAFQSIFTDIMNDGGPIYVAAAGNESLDTIDYPAAAPGVIAVTSVGQTNQFSTDFGEGKGSNYGIRANFSAPGENLILPYMGSTTVMVNGASGTSFSSPFVASAVADILMENPNYTRDQVIEELKLNAEDLGGAGWDQYYGDGSVSFHVNKYADISFDGITIPSDWAQSANVSIFASSTNYNITKYSLVSGNASRTVPSSWNNVGTAGKTVNESYAINKNGTYTLWYKNSNNEIKAKVFNVNNIDTASPTISTNLSASKVSDNSQKLSIGVNDTTSGLAKIEWYYKVGSGEFQSVTDTYTGETGAVTKTHTLTNLAPGSYTAMAKVYDRAGNMTPSNNVAFTVEAPADHITIGEISVPTKWVNTDATVNVNVSSSISNITHSAVVSGASSTEPAASQWKLINAPGISFVDEIKVAENGSYTVWYRNSYETAFKTFTVNKIDKDNPVAKDLAASNLTSSSAKLSLTVSDATSGIAKIEWKYKLANASEYTTKTSTYTDGATSATTKTYTLSGLEVGNYVVFANVYDMAGNITPSGEINFEIEEGVVSDTVTIKSVQVPNTWAKTSTVTVTVESETSNITHRVLLEGTAVSNPDGADWTALDTPSKTLTDTITINKNGAYVILYKNESGETAYETFAITKVDNTAPEIKRALEASEPVGNKVTLTIAVDDTASGVARIDWYYKLKGAEGYALETESIKAGTEYATIQAVTEKTHTFDDLAAGEYVAYAKITDNAGNSINSDEISFTISGSTSDTGDNNENGDNGGNSNNDNNGGNVENPKTGDEITVIASIGGAILAVGAFIYARLRRIR